MRSLAVVVAAIVFAVAPVGRADAQSGLVAAYSFNEGAGTTVADASGNNNTGTIIGATWTTQGRFGNALLFNGTSARVTINNSASLALTNGMTLQAWVYPTAATASWQDVIFKATDIYYLEARSPSGFPAAGGTFVASPSYGTAALPVNTWTHLAATYDRVTLRLYVNGVQVASQPRTVAIATSTDVLAIGGDAAFGQYFAGRIDEVRIYNRALSVAELQTDMNTGVGAGGPDTTPPTVAITTPTAGATFVTNATPLVTLSGTAGDNVAVTQVSWSNSAGGASGTASGTTSWSVANIALQPGANVLTVTARDAANNTTSAVLTVTYDATAPTVSLSAPSAGATLTGPVTVSATASDNVAVAGVQFLLDGNPLGAEVTATPYSLSWNTASAANGDHTLSARARDSAGNTTTSAGVAVTVSNTTPPPVGLVAAYSFNEGSGPTVADASGNNNTGTITGATWTTQGRFGNALLFDGTSARVTINDSPSLRLTTGMTLEAWVKPSAVNTTWWDVIYKGNDNYYLEATSSNGGVPGAGGTFGTTYGTAVLPANTWTHLATTYDRVTLRLYVNGAQVSSLAATAAIATSTNRLEIGGDSIYGQYFQGTIDEVRVYNRALSQAEIQSDMNTAVGGTPTPDTTPPTVAITAPAAGSTVFSLVSVSAAASDNVGIAGVQFYLDSTPLGSEAISPPYSVVWDATTTTAGSHTLTAVARDFAGNTTTSSPVAVTVAATTPSLVGQWSALLAWPIVAVHANLLPTGVILVWDGQSNGNDARLWNPSTGVFTSVPNNQTNVFCSGHCSLADGRLLVAGGHITGHTGPPDTSLFDPVSRLWTLVAPMSTGRWYPTVTTLPDGRVLVTAGETGCQDCDAPIPEVYDPTTNVWTRLTAANLPLPYYPHMFVLPDGRVLAASTSEHPIITYTLDVATQTWSVIDPNVFDGGSAAMYVPGKVVKAGTSYHPDDPIVPSAATTYVLDTSQPVPRWRETAPMVFARTYHTLTLLPDGTVLVTGGGVTTDAVGVSGAVHAPELWSPITEAWSTMASMQAPRLYHSTALLLPDARVLVAGGGRFNGINEPTDQLSAEIYSPPYLFTGPRPTITGAPTTASYGGTIGVQTPDASRIAAVSLIRLGAVTHAINMDQRLLSLSFTTGSGSLTVQAPANANLAPPGHYMLFILDGNGVPSVAAIMKLQ